MVSEDSLSWERLLTEAQDEITRLRQRLIFARNTGYLPDAYRLCPFCGGDWKTKHSPGCTRDEFTYTEEKEELCS